MTLVTLVRPVTFGCYHITILMLKGGACSMAVLGYLEEVAPADSEQVVDDGDDNGEW